MLKRTILSLLACSALLVLVSCETVSLKMPSSKIAKNVTIYYVSPSGNDAWTGTLSKADGQKTDGPFVTVSRAKEAVRALISQGELSKPVFVYIRRGTYFLDEPLVFTPEDSGTKACPVTYASYPGEKAVLSGARPIDRGWTIRDETTLETAYPEVKNGQWKFYQLFVNGERRQRARIPNDGFYQMDGAMNLEGPARFKFHEGEMKKSWAERGDVDLVGLAKWAEIRMPIVSVDEASRTATLTKQVPPSNWRGAKNPRYWIENAPEGLDLPGEWLLNRRTGKLTYLLKKGESLKNLTVLAPHLEQLVILEGQPAQDRYVQHLHFRDLTFSHTRCPKLDEGYPDVQAAYDISAAFSAVGALECRVEKCLFKTLGNYAVSFAQGCKHNRIVGNEMTDLGAGGVKIGEPAMRKEKNLTATNNHVSDNHIYDIGKIYTAAVGVWVGQSAYNSISHNHIHHTFYTGISVGWSWGYHPTGAHHNLIEYNHVHHIGQGVLSDMGGIYTLGTQLGTEIRNNIFHDVQSYGYGGWGIYPDEGSTHILVENNLTYRTKSAGFHQHYGKENIIRNNIFALAKEYQVMRTRAEEHLSFTFEGNIVYWNSGKLLGSNWSGKNFKLDRNLYWDTRQEAIKFSQWTLEDWRAKGQDKNSLIADPLFVNPEKDDFRLKPGSPADLIGFKPFDMKNIGPRREYAR